MTGSASVTRMAAFAEVLKNESMDAFFAWSPTTLGYLTGFSEGAHERFLTLGVRPGGEQAMICPALSATQCRRAGMKNVLDWKDGEDPLVLFRQVAEEWNLRSGMIAVDDELPAHMLLAMQAALPAALFRPGSHLVSQLMRCKTQEELDLMRRAAKIADAALEAGLAAIRPGSTELQVAEAINTSMLELGGSPAFCIIAAGANSAEPHHITDATVIKSGDMVILDYGCTVGGYYSDVTHTVSVGPANDEAKKVYQVVREAHYASRRAIQEGVTAESVDSAGRKTIDAAGYGEFFIHRTGHGIGMRGHEDPYIVQGNQDVLKVGNCFSIEPGIYLPSKFGIRIESIVTVTKDGHEALNQEPSGTLVEV